MVRHVILICVALAAAACSSEASKATGSDAGHEPSVDAGSDGGMPPVDAGLPTYPVYPGCDAPATSFARTIWIDPSATADGGDGSQAAPFHTLAGAFAAKQIAAGDHVVLLAGNHGAVQVSRYNNAQLVDAAAWIWLDFQPGATVQSLDIRDMSSWLITRAEVSAPKVTLVSFNSSSKMVLADSHLYTVQDASGWTADDWINTASNGISVRNGSCVALLRNEVLNTRFGIQIFTDALARPDASMKVLAQGNEVANFSGDAMRVIASDVTVEGNHLHDAYASEADGDSNHDDGLQMWALNGATFDNIVIDGNWVQETTSATRPFQNSLQGIDDFDGIDTHVSITRNVVLVSAYHGISLYGSQDSVIDHNTVANPTRNGHKTWIMVHEMKDGGAAENVTVTNNAATEFSLAQTTTGLVSANDVVVTDPASVYTTFDGTSMSFNLTPQPGSVLDGADAGAPAVMPPASLP